MILNAEGCHYPTVKTLSVLLTVTTLKNNFDFYCLNCLHSFRTNHKFELHKNVCEKKHSIYLLKH